MYGGDFYIVYILENWKLFRYLGIKRLRRLRVIFEEKVFMFGIIIILKVLIKSYILYGEYVRYDIFF